MIPEEKRKLARTLFMEGLKTQQQIAEEVGVSERTIHTWIHKFTWDKLRLFALQAPVTIADNFCSQIVEMQQNIAGRNHGQRFPTAIEAEIMRKLVNSLEKMKKYPSLSTNMQVLETFRNYMRPVNPRFTSDLSKYIERFIEGKSVNSYRPYQLEYGVSAEAPGAFYEEEEDLIPDRVLCGNSPCKSPGNCHDPYCRLPHINEPCADIPPLERYKPDLDHYPAAAQSRNFPAVSIAETTEKNKIAAAISTDEIEILIPAEHTEVESFWDGQEIITPDFNNEGEPPSGGLGVTPPSEGWGSDSRSFSAVSISEEEEKNKIAAAISTTEIEPLTPDFDTEGEPPSGGLGVSPLATSSYTPAP